MKNFSDLSEQELLALAITLEEEDSRIYGEFAHGLQDDYPDTAKLFHAMADEESGATAFSPCFARGLAITSRSSAGRT